MLKTFICTQTEKDLVLGEKFPLTNWYPVGYNDEAPS